VARTRLFEPIGITQYHWNGADPDGNTIANRPCTSPTDMARLGLLWLHDGVWQDRRILPAGWTGKVLATALPAEDDGDFYKRGFWVNQRGRATLPSGGMAKPSWSIRPWTWSSSSPVKVATTKKPT